MRNQVAGLLGVAALAVSGSVQAAGLCVAPGGVGGCFATIAAAIAGATAGTEIKIGAGRYAENVVIPAGLDGLKLTGKGATQSVVNPAAGIGVDIQANNVSVTGLGVRNTAMVPVNIAMNVTGTVLNKLELINAGNGTIACLATGTGATGTQLLSSRLEGCIGAVVTGHDAVVRSNRFVNIGGGAAAIVTGNNAVVEKNIVENALAGDYIVIGDNSAVRNNRSYNSGGSVLNATTNNALYSGNKLFGPFTPITVVAINNPQVLSNSIKEASVGAIVSVACVTNCAQSQVNSNRFEGGAVGTLVVTNTGNGGTINSNLLRNLNNPIGGMIIAGAGQQSVEKNTLRTILGAGINVTATAPARVRSNNVQNSGSAGILITTGTVAHFLEKNVASRNREDGIGIVGGAAPILIGNVTNNNHEEGIENLGGATALSGNTAKGNFNFDYCSPTVPVPAPGNFFGTTGATCI